MGRWWREASSCKNTGPELGAGNEVTRVDNAREGARAPGCRLHGRALDPTHKQASHLILDRQEGAIVKGGRGTRSYEVLQGRREVPMAIKV
jgi:hypothetical protein